MNFDHGGKLTQYERTYITGFVRTNGIPLIGITRIVCLVVFALCFVLTFFTGIA